MGVFASICGLTSGRILPLSSGINGGGRSLDSVVVIGASHAGVACVEALRRNGFAGRLTLIDSGADLPMERPPLSKAFLLFAPGSASAGAGSFLLRQASWYQDNDIDLRLGATVTSLDAGVPQLVLGDETLGYDALVLATGATPRQLPAATGLAGVHVLRSPDDAALLRQAMSSATSAIIIGGGYIGLEAAASLGKMGKKVHVIEAADRLLARVASPQISMFFEALHRDHGTHLHTGVAVADIDAVGGAFAGVRLGDGSTLTADLLLVGIGVQPNMQLAETAIACGNGILVGPDMQTSHPGIYAIGDVALATALAPQIDAMPIRVESVHNAQDSAARAAAALTGAKPPARQAPWFWSEQFDVRLQSAGIVPPLAMAFSRLSGPENAMAAIRSGAMMRPGCAPLRRCGIPLATWWANAVWRPD